MKFLSAPETELPFDLTMMQAAAFGVIALLLILMLVRAMRNRRRANVLGMRDCRWRRDRKGAAREGFTRWQCKSCGVSAYSSDGKVPKECKRVLMAGGL